MRLCPKRIVFGLNIKVISVSFWIQALRYYYTHSSEHHGDQNGWSPIWGGQSPRGQGGAEGLGSGPGVMCRTVLRRVSRLTAVVQDSVQTLTPLSRFLSSRPEWKEKKVFPPFTFTHADTLLLWQNSWKCFTNKLLRMEFFLVWYGEIRGNHLTLLPRALSSSNKWFWQLGTKDIRAETWFYLLF